MNKILLYNDFKSSESKSIIRKSFESSSMEYETKNQGLGRILLQLRFFRKDIKVLTINMFLDLMDYDHTIDYIKHVSSIEIPLELSTNVSDYFYYVVYQNNLLVAKCKSCKNLILDPEDETKYKCIMNQRFSINHTIRTCKHFNRSSHRVKKIQKSYLTAQNLFGENINVN